MANETTYSAISGDYSFSFWTARENMIQALYQGNNITQMFKRRSLAGVPSDTMRFPKPPVLAASSLVDGTDMAASAYSPDNSPVTVGEVGLMLIVTDLNNQSSIVDYEQYGFDAGQAVAEKLTTDSAALAGGLSNTTSDSGNPLTEAMWHTARTALRARKVRGTLGAFLHDYQWTDLIQSIGSQVSAAATTGTSPRQVLNDLADSGTGDAGVILNVATVTNSVVATANAGANRAGAMFAVDRTFGHVEKWAIRPEMSRDASLRAEEIVVTTAYGVAELDDISGQAIISDNG